MNSVAPSNITANGLWNHFTGRKKWSADAFDRHYENMLKAEQEPTVQKTTV